MAPRLEELLMPNFKPDNYDQDTMLVINYLEQLELDGFALTLHHPIETTENHRLIYAPATMTTWR